MVIPGKTDGWFEFKSVPRSPAGATRVLIFTTAEPPAPSPKNAPILGWNTCPAFQLVSAGMLVLQFALDTPSQIIAFVVTVIAPKVLKLVTPQTRPGPGTYG